MADAAGRVLRQAAMDRLAVLDQCGDLSSDHVRLTAETLGVTERTVWRWVAAMRTASTSAASPRFRIDAQLRVRLAYWRGNASALHRELRQRERDGGPPAPSLSTIHRAIRVDMTRGDIAGLRAGERSRRKFDVFLKRPSAGQYRNAVWETDHVEAAVEVDVDGRLMKPWVTWFVDTAHCVIMGAAVTPRTPNRESILAALRASILRTPPYGPAGGLPTVVRIDQGKDFLSRTVSDAMGAFAVRVVDLPGYTPHLKGTIETINGAMERMLVAEMPRYTHAQTGINGARVDPDAPALPFEAFVAELLAGWTDGTPASTTTSTVWVAFRLWSRGRLTRHRCTRSTRTRCGCSLSKMTASIARSPPKGSGSAVGATMWRTGWSGWSAPWCGCGTCPTTPTRSRYSTPNPVRTWVLRPWLIKPHPRLSARCAVPVIARLCSCGRIWPRRRRLAASDMPRRLLLLRPNASALSPSPRRGVNSATNASRIWRDGHGRIFFRCPRRRRVGCCRWISIPTMREGLTFGEHT